MKTAPALINFQLSLKLFLLLIQGKYDQAIDFSRANNISDHQFYDFLTRNYLKTFTQANVPSQILIALLPQSYSQLTEFFQKQQVKQSLLIDEWRQIMRKFSAANQTVILLKGPYLATRFFGGLYQRGFSDIDLLIKREQLDTFDQLLLAHGYQRRSKVLINSDVTANFTHAFDYIKDKVIVDLHWLLASHISYQIDYDRLWREQQRYTVDGELCAVLSDEYEILFNLLALMRDIERGAARLKSFIDLYFILANTAAQIDWPQFWQHRRADKTYQVSVNMLVLFINLFNCSERFPELFTTLQREAPDIDVNFDQAATLFFAGPGAARNKLWAAGIYQCSPLNAGLWWLVSLPFRLAVHQHSSDNAPSPRLNSELSSANTDKDNGDS